MRISYILVSSYAHAPNETSQIVNSCVKGQFGDNRENRILTRGRSLLVIWEPKRLILALVDGL